MLKRKLYNQTIMPLFTTKFVVFVVVGALAFMTTLDPAESFRMPPLPSADITSRRHQDLTNLRQSNGLCLFESKQITPVSKASTKTSFKLPADLTQENFYGVEFFPKLIGWMTVVGYTLAVWCTIGIALIGLSFPTHLYIIPR